MVSDYDAKSSDYETTMQENLAEASDYKMCPILAQALINSPVARTGRHELLTAMKCIGPRCAWYDQTAERCAVLFIARNK